jgi:Rha family phage regulatory protein
MAKSPARRTAPRIAVVNGLPTTTSRDIAETFGKRHDDVLKRIRSLDCSTEFTARNFAGSEYTDPTGRKLTEYRITRDGFAFLCMGFTGARAAAWKEKYINTFNRLAEAAHKPKAIKPATLAAPRLAIGHSPTLSDAIKAQIDLRAWEIAGAAHLQVRDWLTHQVKSGCLRPDGSPAPNLANTLAGADLAAFTTQYASTNLQHASVLLGYIHSRSGEMIKELAEKMAHLSRKDAL